jgi:cell division protein ZapA
MGGIVTVEIAGQRYPIRSMLDPAYVAELAAYVEKKVRAASEVAPASDVLGLTVLAALNIADECFRARDQRSVGDHTLGNRTLELEAIVDRALAV